ncbi:MAG: TraY domain-containing protein [Spirochaetaceae bacterium]|nr:TraY domain-containing protein [Spirochaetaceae bacterium]
MLRLRLKPELENRLAELAAKTGRTKTFYAIQAIEQQLDDIEDYYLAENSYQDWITNGKKTYTMDEVFD